jgi:hypothetical protein
MKVDIDIDWQLMVALADKLARYTSRAELVVKTSDDSPHYRIERVVIGFGSIELWATGDNFRPSHPVVYDSYDQLLDAVIRGAAR